MLRFLHTADLQIGMPFKKFPGDAGALLRRARLDVLDTLARLADEHEVAFTLIAGDFFDSNTLEAATIAQACDKLRAFSRDVYLIPGNHDYGGPPNSVYNQPAFMRACPEHVHVLQQREPVVVAEGAAVILPAPLLQRHTWGDASAHIDASFGTDVLADGIRIGLAHGDVAGFERRDAEARNHIAPDRATQAKLDYLALGDWHGTKQIDARTWYSGAPEPDRFSQPDAGGALLVAVAEAGAPPEVRRLETGRIKWLRLEAEISAAADVDALAEQLGRIEDPANTLAHVALRGALSLAAHTRLSALLDEHEQRLLHMRRRLDALQVAPDADEVARMQLQGYFCNVASELQAAAESAEGDAAKGARDALALLYQLQQQALEATQ